MFFFTYVFFLVDSFVIAAVPQLINLVLLVAILILWEKVKNHPRSSMLIILRVIQIITILELIVSFFVQLPLVADDFQEKHKRLLEVFGIFGVQSDAELIVYARIHFCTGSLAIVFTELYDRASYL